MSNAKSMSLRARINNFSKLHGISPPTMDAFKTSYFQRDQWRRYILKMPFAKDIAFDDVIVSLENVLAVL